MNKNKKIAIIGSGISGLSAAYFLKKDYAVTLYERNHSLGGHSRTISIVDNQNQTIDVDTGFIVLNDRTYPHLEAFFKSLHVEIEKTQMSFSVSANNGELEWAGTSIDSLFAQRKNIFNCAMLRGIADVLRFNHKARHFVEKAPDLTLRQLIEAMGLGSWFRDYYILPMGGAIWSAPFAQVMDFPASTFVNFFHNHGLLSLLNRPQWYTLKNKSISYVRAIEAALQPQAEIIKNAQITAVVREAQKVRICVNSSEAFFDEVIFACHPKEILKLLHGVTLEEQEILSQFSWQKNITYTHCDPSCMPKLRKCWSSWNYLYDKDVNTAAVSVTYWMNQLQNIAHDSLVLVTLNPNQVIDSNKIYDTHVFYHPVFDKAAIKAQKSLESIQGADRLWFCGAYLRYGFHEDGIWSALNVVERLQGNCKS